MMINAEVTSKYQGRVVVAFSSRSLDDVIPQGVVIAPARIKTDEAALNAVGRAYSKAVKANAEEKDFNDVIDNLIQAGFEYMCSACWESRFCPTRGTDRDTNGSGCERKPGSV